MKIFDNTEIAFSLKSNSEIKRAYLLFKMIASKPLVKIGTTLTNIALKLHLPVQALIRATVFDQFCGGITVDDCAPNIMKLNSKNVYTVLDYSVEGKETEEQFDFSLKTTLETIDVSVMNPSIPFTVFKPTAYGRFELWEKITARETLTTEEQEEWERVVARFHKACSKAKECNVPLLIDGEESWMQDAADDLVELMMETYNTEKAIIFNTLQMYRHDRLAYLKELHQRAHQKGYYLGFKVVRGAYMEKERARAEAMGYASPICVDKQATDINYDAAIVYIMEHKNMSLFAGTHNEESSYKLMELAKEHKIDRDDRRLWFSQLYGMSDHITYNLAQEGYNVAKYMPYGLVRDVMPYLIRRAQENTSVAGQTSRELMLLKQELIRRKL